MTGWHTYQAVVIGVSAGGLKALKTFISGLPEDFDLPLVIVQHIGAHSDGSWLSLLGRKGVKEADEKEAIQNGVIYVAPPNYHLMIEKDKTLSLNIDEKVNFARPSVDVLFESAAEAYGPALIGVILTGSGSDGARGLSRIKERGGLAIVQDPATAESASMPNSAIAMTQVDHILPLEGIRNFLIKVDNDIKQSH